MGWRDTIFQRDSKIREMLKIKREDIFGAKAQFIIKSIAVHFSERIRIKRRTVRAKNIFKV